MAVEVLQLLEEEREEVVLRIVVTGGAGFLGSHLVDRLIIDKHDVLVIDNLTTGRNKYLSSAMRCSGLPGRGTLHTVYCNIRTGRAYRAGNKFNPDRIYNLASPADPPDYKQRQINTLLTGSEGVHNMLHLAEVHGARFLQASTSEVYGNPMVNPQSETYNGNVDPVGPRSCYDESKRFAEALCTAYGVERGVEIRIARIFNTYGPRLDDGRMIPQFIRAAFDGRPIPVHAPGTQTRSLCYVSDMVEGLVRLMESDCEGPVNLGSQNERTVLEIAKEIAESGFFTGSEIEMMPNPCPQDPAVRCPDTFRARIELDWTPQVYWLEGIRRTIEWFKENW